MSKVLVAREDIEAVRNTLANGGSAVGVLRWAESVLAPPAEAEGELADRMRASGMMTVDEMMAGAPLDSFIKHAGVNDLETYSQWLDMKCREFLVMQATRDLEKREGDDLYEWVLAHAAVFQSARINFKEAYAQHLAAMSAVTAERDQLRAEVEALRKDAERYRWMRARFVFACRDFDDAGRGMLGLTFKVPGDDWLGCDESIDAAMAAKEG